MARVVGELIRNTNYEVTIKKPLDARSLVKSYADLTLESNWLNSSGKSVAYNGMLVAVANTSDTSKNGLYFLFDINCTSSLKSPNVTLESNWIKIGETSEVGDFAERLSKIDAELTDLENRLTALEEKNPDVFTFDTYSVFPGTGIEGILYVAIDDRKSYVWIDSVGYICVGETNDGAPDIIHGGTAD